MADVRESEWSIGRLLAWTKEHLSRHGVQEARLAAEMLLAHAAKCRRIDLYTRFERVLEEPQLAMLRDSVKRAARHEPIAYLVGEKEFFSLPFFVTRDVLIPRPETETLVEWAIDHCAVSGVSAPRILDIGTGSGCLIIPVLVNVLSATGVATDISAAALEVARMNAQRNKVLERLSLLSADGVNLPPDAVRDGFDIVLCNPPYIPAQTVGSLAVGVRDFEPRVALTDESDGLAMYRALGRADGLLRPKGLIIVEVGDGQAEVVRRVIDEQGILECASGRKDRITGRERAVGFVRRTVEGAMAEGNSCSTSK